MKLGLIAGILGLTLSSVSYAGSSLSKDGFLMLEVASHSKLKGTKESLKMTNEVLVNFYNSSKTIESIDEPLLREWVTTASKLYASGKVLSAQILINEIKSTNQSPALKLMRTATTDATEIDSDDPESAKANQIYMDHTKRYVALPGRIKACASLIVKSSIYADDVASSYGQACLNSVAPDLIKTALADAEAAKRKVDRLR